MRLIAAELADHAQQDRPRLRAGGLKFYFAFAGIGLDVVEPFEEIGIPRDAPVLAVGDGFQPDRLLLADHAFDLAVLDFLERVLGDFAARPFFPRRFKRGRAQQTADVVGAERRLFPAHH